MTMRLTILLVTSLLAHGILCSTVEPEPETKPILRVSTIVEAPFINMADISVDGNAKYSGFIKDLLTEMTSYPEINSDFELQTVDDGQYGRKILRDKWSGMIGELHRKEVDVAAAALVPSAESRQVVEFSRAYMQGGITMLMYHDNSDTKGPSIRLPQDILNRTDVTPGFVQYSSTQYFFESSSDPVYRKLYDRMQLTTTKPSPYAVTVQEGINMLREYKGKYVLFIDSNMADFYAGSWPCDLVMSGDVKRQHFALAFQKGSPLKPQFDSVLEQMNRNGQLENLVNRWWRKECKAKYTWDTPPQTIGVAVEAVAGQTTAAGQRTVHAIGVFIHIILFFVTRC